MANFSFFGSSVIHRAFANAPPHEVDLVYLVEWQ